MAGTRLSIVSHVAEVELDLGIPERVAHLVLLLFVAREDADLPDIRAQEPLQDGVAERTGAARDQKSLSAEHGLVLPLMDLELWRMTIRVS